MAFEAGLNVKNNGTQRFSFDEIVRQLIERAIKVVVRANITFKSADQNLAFESPVSVEREICAFTYNNAVRQVAWDEFVSDQNGFIEKVMKDFQLCVVDEEKTNSRFIEDWPNEFLMRADDTRGRPHLRKIIEDENDAL